MRSIALAWLGATLFSYGASAAKIEIEGPPGSSKFGTTVAIVKHGNIVVVDPGWPNGQSLGSVKMYSPAGVLLGSFNGEGTRRVGQAGVFVLEDGNFVVLSTRAEMPGCSFSLQGAATWVDVDAGLPATLTAGNSLVCLNADEPDELKKPSRCTTEISWCSPSMK